MSFFWENLHYTQKHQKRTQISMENPKATPQAKKFGSTINVSRPNRIAIWRPSSSNFFKYDT